MVSLALAKNGTEIDRKIRDIYYFKMIFVFLRKPGCGVR
jgi:hypothetical protein